MKVGWMRFLILVLVAALAATACKKKQSDPDDPDPVIAISSILPVRGPATGGTAVTISGNHFAAGATVTIGGTAATNVVVVNATTITATTPAGALGAADVVVTNPDTTFVTLTGGFTYDPVITSINPAAGPTAGGQAVTISGAGFDTVNPGTFVRFDGTAATNVTVVNATTITATTPAHAAATVDVVVENPTGETATLANGYEYTDVLTITGITPNEGPHAGGTAITISGANLSGATSGTIGGTAIANFAVVNDNTITGETPASGGVVTQEIFADVVVTDGVDSSTLTDGFLYRPAPTVTAINPAVGSTAGGTAVTITGTNFRAGATVEFDGTAATNVTVVNATTITATTPAHAAATVDVVVENVDGQFDTLGAGFTYSAPPTVDTICPANNALFISTWPKIEIEFDQAMQAASLVSANITLDDSNQAGVAITITVNSATEITITPDAMLAANETYTLTLSTGVLNSDGLGFSSAASFSFTTGTAGSWAEKDIEILGQIDDPTTFGGLSNNLQARAFFAARAEPHAEIIFAQDEPIAAPITPASTSFNAGNPPTIQVSGAPDLTTVFAAGSTVVVSGSILNDGSYRVALVSADTLTLESFHSLNTEFSPTASLDGTNGIFRMVRQTWDESTGLGTADLLDASNTDNVVRLHVRVSVTGQTAAALRITRNSGDLLDMSVFVYSAATNSWTDGPASLITTDEMWGGGGGNPDMPDLTFRGEVPTVFWINGDRDAIYSEFVGGTWDSVAIYSNPGGAPAAFIGGSFMSEDRGGLLVGIIDGGFEGYLYAYDANRAGDPFGTPTLALTAQPATLANGDSLAGVPATTGDIVLFFVMNGTEDTLHAIRYRAATDTFEAVEEVFESSSGDLWRFVVGTEFGGGDNRSVSPTASLNATLDGMWVFVTEDDALRTTRGLQYNATDDTWGNDTFFSVPALSGPVQHTAAFADANGDTHFFLIQETTPVGDDAHVYYYFYDAQADTWSAGVRVDDATAEIPRPAQPRDADRTLAFDSVFGLGRGVGFVTIEERDSGSGNSRLYANRLVAGTAGTSERLGEAGAGQNEREPRLSTDMAGNCGFAWLEDTAGGTELKIRRYLDCDGEYETPAAVFTHAGVQSFAVDRRIAPPPTGRWSGIILIGASGTGIGNRLHAVLIRD